MLSFRFLLGAALSSIVITGAVAPAQGPAFDVATIKVNTSGLVGGPGARQVGFDAGGGFTMIDGATMVLIRSAWPDSTEVIGAPDWVSSEHYDVLAKTELPATREQRTLMLRALLADRFRLIAREEQREQPAYALVLDRDDGRLGPNLRRYDGNCAASAAPAPPGDATIELPAPSNGAPACGFMRGGRRMAAGGISMDLLARNLRGDAGRVVVDRTELAGVYEFTLETSPDLAVVTALREQLGLKLEPIRVALPVVVVERIERPTPD
jgi:uncharacterized protein (TIGR03435 family)